MNEEIIISIDRVKNIIADYSLTDWGNCDGYLVKTNERDVYILIDNTQRCDEYWGYITSEDNLKKFVGTEVIEFYTTDRALKPNKVKLDELRDLGDLFNAIFVNLKTTKGVLQFAVYNVHNGHYRHNVGIFVVRKTISETFYI